MKNKWFKKEWWGFSLLLLCLNFLTACAPSPAAPPTLPPSTTLAPFTPTTAPVPTATFAPTVTPTINPTATPVPTPTPVPFTGKLVNAWQTAPDSDFFSRMRYLTGVAVDSKGNLYVLNNLIGQILKYDSSGNLLADLSRPGQPAIPSKITTESAQNRVGHPGAVAIDRQDNLYVLDTQSYGIHRFDAAGQYLGQFRPDFSTSGSGSLSGMAVDENGIIYLLDRSIGAIKKFDTTGKFLGSWGNPPGQFEPEPKDGYFKYPTAIGADGQGHIYVADTGNHRIEKFDLNGKFLLQWGSRGKDDSQFSENIGAPGFDALGNIFVPDVLNNRVQEFDSQGRFLAKFGSQGSGNGQFKLPFAVAVDHQGQLYVADYGNERVQKLANTGRWLASFGRQDQGEGKLSWPMAAGVDAAGNLYAADSYPPSVQKFDNQGRFLLRWELPLKDTAGYNGGDPLSLALDSSGNVYLGVSSTQHILKYDSQGHLLLEWGHPGSGAGQFNGIRGLTVDRHNQLWVADGGNYRLQKFDEQGHFLSELDFNFYKEAGPDERYKDAPVGIALDDQDQLFVLFSPFLRKFDSQGKFLVQWGDPQSGSGENSFVLANNVFVDGQGLVYVYQEGDFHGSGSRFQEFDNQGHLRFTWQSPLHLPMDPYITVVPPGQFIRFSAMTVDQAGNFYLASATLGRVDKFLQR